MMDRTEGVPRHWRGDAKKRLNENPLIFSGRGLVELPAGVADRTPIVQRDLIVILHAPTLSPAKMSMP